MSLGVSVIICTYNGGKRLPETLRHLALQIVPKSMPWEILVVNNASTDSTAAIAKQEWEKYNNTSANFTIIEQPIPGKNYAFFKGLQVARYEYLLTCDDDNWLNPNYIAQAFQIMQADLKIGALGGLGIFEPQTPVNKEIAGYESYYVNGIQTWVDTDHWVYGAGSIYRKSIYLDLINENWKLITPGRVGNKLNGGEDVEYCFMAYLSGYKIIADDRLVFKHYVPLKRQTLAYIVEMAYWINYSVALLNSYYSILNNDERPINKLMNDNFLKSFKTLIKQIITNSFINLKTWGANRTELKIAIESTWGTFSCLLKNRKKISDHHHQIKKILAVRKDRPILIKL